MSVLLAGTPVTVLPGAPQVVGPQAMPAGTTIVNHDSVNAVWLSASPSVAPGFGIRLGPLGSTTWQSGGVQAYACVDTGVTSGVQLYISGSVAPPVNPVDVATATTNQLVASGIPIVYKQTTLHSAPPLTVGGPVTIDTTGYGSLIILLSVVNTNPASSINVGVEDSYGFAELLTVPIQPVGLQFAWILPCNGNPLRFTTFNTSVNLTVIGSTKPASVMQQTFYTRHPRVLQTNNIAATTPGQINMFVSADGGTDTTHCNGDIIIGWGANQTVNGSIFMRWNDINNNVQDTYILFNGPNQTLNVRTIHPCIPILWGFFSNGTYNNLGVNLSIIPT